MAKHSRAKLIIELSAKNMSRREIARTRHISVDGKVFYQRRGKEFYQPTVSSIS